MHPSHILSLIYSHYMLRTFVFFDQASENLYQFTIFLTIHVEDDVDEGNNDMDTSSHRAEQLAKVSAMSFISLSMLDA